MVEYSVNYGYRQRIFDQDMAGSLAETLVKFEEFELDMGDLCVGRLEIKEAKRPLLFLNYKQNIAPSHIIQIWFFFGQQLM